MADNITVAIRIKTKKFKPKKIMLDGTTVPLTRAARVRVRDPSGGDLHVRRTKSGKKLIIEGSFIRFLQGHNVICPMDVQAIVKEVTKRVLKAMDIEPTREEQSRIDKGEVKLDRLDVVGWVKIHDFSGSIGHVIAALDFGLAGSFTNRLIVATQTLVWNAFSKYWTLMLYNKERQMESVYPDQWGNLPNEVKEICRRHIRVELRILRKGLRELDWNEVRDVTEEKMRAEFELRYAAFLADIRTPLPPLPVSDHKVTKPLLIALLKALGVDMTKGLKRRARARYEKLMEQELGVLRRHHAGLPEPYNRQIADLKKVPVRFGIPKRLRKKRLVYVP